MDPALKRVWVAAAAVEMLQGGMDRIQAALDEAIREALDAGVDPDAIACAVNLLQ
jgi:hypothetical protein